MTLETWPSELDPMPRRDKWAIPKSGRAPEQTAMQTGNVRMRRQPGSSVTEMQVGYRWTPDELAIFDTFTINTIHEATDYFTMDVWDGQQVVEDAVVQIIDGIAGISRAPGGRRTEVVFKLRVYNLF